MKIWILSSETPHFRAGGIARYVDNFARLAGAGGNQVTVIAYGEKDAEREIGPGYHLVEFKDRQEQAMRPHPGIEPDAHPGWPYNNMTPPAALSYQISGLVLERIDRHGPPDIIECQDYAALGYFLLMRKLCGEERLAGVPILVHLHSPDFIVQKLNQYPRYKLPDYWIGRMERACIWMADAVLSPSRFLACEIQKHLEGDRDHIAVIPYPHGPVESSPPATAHKADTFLYVGRIELRKGVEELLRTCDGMWASGATFRLELAGGDVHTPLRGGSLKKYLENRYKKHVDSGRLVFHGNIDYTHCMELMQPARAVIVPSLWENFPNVCIEAMARGKLVVASSNGGQAEMLGTDGEAGILFSHAERGSLQAALERAMQLDDNTVERMGREANARITQLCDPARIIRERLFHLHEVIDRHKPRATFPFSNRSLREGPHATPLPDRPLVSVVIPYYNLGKYLQECVDSVQASREVDFEVVIVNDGSTDPLSVEALDTLRRQDLPNIRILDIPNGGLANARNTGAKAAKGELVAFVDADDAIEPDFLNRAVALMQRYPNVHLAYSWIRYFDGGKGVWHAWTFDLPYLLCHNQLIPIVVVRRESFLMHGQNKPHIVYGLEDYEGWWSMAEAGCGGVAIPETLVRYRIRGDSMFRVIEPDKKLYLYDLISAEHPGLMARYGLELFNLQNANGPAYAWDQPTMFRAPQDRLMNRANREEAKRTELEEENRKLKEAEEWHKKERERLLKALQDQQR